MKLSQVQTIDELRRRAKRRLPRVIYDFIEGGAGDELGVVNAAKQYADYRIVPRYLLDVRPRSQEVTLFGGRFRSPFGIAPTGYAGVYRVKGEELLAEAARDAGVPIILSGSGIASIETVSRIAGQNAWFQLYAAREAATSADLIRRAADCGVETLVVTVDLPLPGRRYRNARNGFKVPPTITPSLLLDVLRHPAWTIDYLRSGGLPAPGSWAPYAPAGAGPAAVAEVMRQNASSPLTWRDIESFRSQWKGNLVLKGVLHPEDARMAAGIGVDGLIVSNHGGRQFDRAPTPAEALPPIVAAVGDRMTVMTDGGITKGSDILVAFALGAKFVFTGRATLWGLTAAGLAGVERALSILRDEVDAGLAQTGALTMDGLASATLVPPAR
ncbi:MAG TPA: alpha-hydroxy acid oxidase [Bauldia sp.]|nr:alpha-hydroxy acid oxidase [Bauldia sp.]